MTTLLLMPTNNTDYHKLLNYFDVSEFYAEECVGQYFCFENEENVETLEMLLTADLIKYNINATFELQY